MEKLPKLPPAVCMRSPRINPCAPGQGPSSPRELKSAGSRYEADARGPSRVPRRRPERCGESVQTGARTTADLECARGIAGCSGRAHGAVLLFMQFRLSLSFFFFSPQNKCPAAAAASSGAFNSPLAASLHMPAAPIPFTVPAPLTPSRYESRFRVARRRNVFPRYQDESTGKGEEAAFAVSFSLGD